MRVYNVTGYAIIGWYALCAALLAPAHLGPAFGLLVGALYFVGCWFTIGVYLADVLHLGIAHRSLDFRAWFTQAITLFNNVFGIYVEPVSWVNRHRLHHQFADHDGDPNKLERDGFWRTMWLCVFPYRCQADVANDAILKSWPFRLSGNPVFAVVAQAASFAGLSWLVGSWLFAAVLWVNMRIFALWVNMIQNYWTHTRAFGYRRYDDAHDNAMNLGEWLPVTASFSACYQNNHHHHPSLMRLSHDEAEYDFGFLTVKAMKALGLVKATARRTSRWPS
jgi:stearoyl-CoA desaturase (delta-9 desaturase)